MMSLLELRGRCNRLGYDGEYNLVLCAEGLQYQWSISNWLSHSCHSHQYHEAHCFTASGVGGIDGLRCCEVRHEEPCVWLALTFYQSVSWKGNSI